MNVLLLDTRGGVYLIAIPAPGYWIDYDFLRCFFLSFLLLGFLSHYLSFALLVCAMVTSVNLLWVGSMEWPRWIGFVYLG